MDLGVFPREWAPGEPLQVPRGSGYNLGLWERTLFAIGGACSERKIESLDLEQESLGWKFTGAALAQDLEQ